MHGWYIVAIVTGSLGLVVATVSGIMFWYFCIKHDKHSEDGYSWAHGIGIALMILAVCMAIGAAVGLKSATYEYEKFVNTQQVFEQVYKEENELENIKLTEEILEMNQWLIEAKASKSTYGCFSTYYYVDLDELEPIGGRN